MPSAVYCTLSLRQARARRPIWPHQRWDMYKLIQVRLPGVDEDEKHIAYALETYLQNRRDEWTLAGPNTCTQVPHLWKRLGTSGSNVILMLADTVTHKLLSGSPVQYARIQAQVGSTCTASISRLTAADMRPLSRISSVRLQSASMLGCCGSRDLMDEITVHMTGHGGGEFLKLWELKRSVHIISLMRSSRRGRSVGMYSL